MFGRELLKIAVSTAVVGDPNGELLLGQEILKVIIYHLQGLV